MAASLWAPPFSPCPTAARVALLALSLCSSCRPIPKLCPVIRRRPGSYEMNHGNSRSCGSGGTPLPFYSFPSYLVFALATGLSIDRGRICRYCFMVTDGAMWLRLPLPGRMRGTGPGGRKGMHAGSFPGFDRRALGWHVSLPCLLWHPILVPSFDHTPDHSACSRKTKSMETV
nr:hypothetical protein CFP56_66144 [Quercus suber]